MDDYKKQAKSDINLKKGKTVDVIEKRESGECFVVKYSNCYCFFSLILVKQIHQVETSLCSVGNKSNPCKADQDSLGCSIPRCKFWIPGGGFRILVSGAWIPNSNH